MKGYDAADLESALCRLWTLVEDRLSKEELDALIKPDHDEYYARFGKKPEPEDTCGIFAELRTFGPNGPVGIGLGRCGGHAV